MISERAKRAGLKELEIFDNFEVDRNLPKYHSENGDAKVEVQNVYIPIQTTDWGTQSTALTNLVQTAWVSIPQESVPVNTVFNTNDGEKFGKRNIKNWLISKLEGKKKGKSPKKISIVDFFANVTKSCEELTTIEEIAKYYEDALKQSFAMGQIALIQKLKDNLDVVKGEAVLIAIGLRIKILNLLGLKTLVESFQNQYIK
jgi:hypothetical protein